MAKKVLTHIDADGRARMVDVSEKSDTVRVAVAEGRVVMSAQTLAAALLSGGKKGDVMAVAEIAGVMAAKRTAELIPMCHPLPCHPPRCRCGRPPTARASASPRG